ncbi:MAG: M23 family metallopeptidase [Clostridia bacterium]|nr:M23 family metallopeptidase [Clostridia bacterium]
MSKISDIIFNGAKHYVTSPYGKRNTISTSAGSTSSFHYGTDYGTNGKKLPQYAIENGVVLSCSTAKDGAKYIWVKYPRIGKKFLHYHLDSISVKTGQSVTKGTLLGKTGKTGKATGVHLHLGVKDLKTDAYEDPEIFAKNYAEQYSYTCGYYVVTADILNVRSAAGTQQKIKTFSQFTSNAQKQIMQLSGRKVNGYVKNLVCSVSAISAGCWGKTPSGWICLEYCKKV